MVSQITLSLMIAEHISFDWSITSAFQSGPLLGASFILGLLIGGLGVRLLYHRSTDTWLQAFTLTDLLASETGPNVWNPFRVRTTLTSDEEAANTERVLRILIANEGRMKQTDFAEITGWSDSTVSRLLSRMEREGDISRVNVGRRKLVFLGELREDGPPKSSPDAERIGADAE